MVAFPLQKGQTGGLRVKLLVRSVAKLANLLLLQINQKVNLQAQSRLLQERPLRERPLQEGKP